jgi:hypothetical protein
MGARGLVLNDVFASRSPLVSCHVNCGWHWYSQIHRLKPLAVSGLVTNLRRDSKFFSQINHNFMPLCILQVVTLCCLVTVQIR